jgi:2-dehydro-3-deoxyphosphogluconate aldolase/(4S)-4-hydroxy-2-oxoglutarate aldolase
MNNLEKRLFSRGTLPIIIIHRAEQAIPIAQALHSGTLDIIEITLRTPCSVAALKQIAMHCPNVTVGAGTVTSLKLLDEALEAGAKFIVTPAFSEKIIGKCIDLNIPVCPGCTSPRDFQSAFEMGLECVKFYPAEATGGMNYINTVISPLYPSLRFIATGGINFNTIMPYLASPNVVAAGGNFMAPLDIISAEDYDAIASNARRCINIMLGETIENIKKAFKTNNSFYNSSGKPAFSAPNIERVRLYLAEKGIQM